jgi:nucleoside-diphosphate-sugar epimerase
MSSVGNATAVPPTAVVTGASGWLGQNLVRALVRQPQRRRVRCLVHDPYDAALLDVVSAKVETVVGDVRDPVAIDRLFEGVGRDSVFHAAGVIHPRRRTREMFDVNIGGTQLVLDRARRVQAERFVHVSSNSPFGANPTEDDLFTEESSYAPYMAYGQSKQEAEQLVQRAYERGDQATVIVRPPWFYGPYQPARQTQFFAAVRRSRFPYVRPGTQRRSMVFTGNLVNGLLLAEAREAAAGQSYWIADAEPYALGDILRTVRAAMEAEGLSVSRRRVPSMPRLCAVAAESVDRAAQSTGRYVQAAHVLGELKDTIACDIGKAKRELGYEPTIGLFEGMRMSIRWCLDRGAVL